MSESTQAPAFAIRDLVHRFPGFTLGPLDLDLEPGGVLALIGPNGAGKTTTLNCLAGLLTPDAGTVEIFERRNDVRDPSWRLDVGLVGEEHGFFERWTGAQNLAFLSRLHPGWSAARAGEMAKRFSLPLERRVRDMSKGNRTKLAVVAALAPRPRLLLLDEPTAGLDPVVRAEVLDVLWELLEDGEHAILYSTHVLSDIVRLADELVFLVDGRILQRTNKDDLVDAWRRISFRLASVPPDLPGVVGQQSLRLEHQVISRDGEATLAALTAAGAESIEATHMAIDEIAVEILKGGGGVAIDR